MAIRKGLGFVYGAGGITVTGIITNVTGRIQSSDFNRQANKELMPNEDGETVGGVWYDPTRTLGVAVIPSGTGLGAAKGNLDALLPAPGTTFTVIDADSAVVDSTPWVIESAKLGRSNKGFATVNLELFNSEVTDLSIGQPA